MKELHFFYYKDGIDLCILNIKTFFKTKATKLVFYILTCHAVCTKAFNTTLSSQFLFIWHSLDVTSLDVNLKHFFQFKISCIIVTYAAYYSIKLDAFRFFKESSMKQL